MNAFNKIIGYAEIRQELTQIADTLKNREVYKALGAASPSGLLLYGVPGVGKTLMAKCLIEASGLKVFTCRKAEPNGEFIKTIRETFGRAVESTPAIVFLDDMDKFANDDQNHRDSEEFVAVQACIDEVKGKEVFVLATANDVGKLPRSLVRAGRFDRAIKVNPPEGKDAEDIIRYYLSNKKLADDLEPETIAAILSGRSCATLETVINEAALLAGYRREERITMAHILEASLCIVHHFSPGIHTPIDLSTDNNGARTVFHEAGHAVIAELLSPGSVTLAITRIKGGEINGFTKTRPTGDLWNLHAWEQKILIFLAGRAAVEMQFGVFEFGAGDDLEKAFDNIERLVTYHGYAGFGFCDILRSGNTEALDARQEAAIAAETERFYRRVKELLHHNREFLAAVAHTLAEKGILTAADVRNIRERFPITEPAA